MKGARFTPAQAEIITRLQTALGTFEKWEAEVIADHPNVYGLCWMMKWEEEHGHGS
jgi:hypothetical protein